jgi:uncharacterized phiE125 gp8 family phage protein
MAFEILVNPVIEPVSLAETKTWLRVDHAEEDDLITGLITTARKHAETLTSRAMITQTILETCRVSVPVTVLELALRPLQTVEFLGWLEPGGAVHELNPTEFEVDANRHRIVLGAGTSHTWFQVRYIAGYGSAGADVPASLKTAILVHIAWMYGHREEGIFSLPHGAQTLLAPFVRIKL